MRNMKMGAALTLGLALLAGGPAEGSAEETAAVEPREGKTWLAQALDQVDLRRKGAQGFRLAIDLRFYDEASGGPASGYLVSWFDAAHWREELKIPGAQLQRGSDAGIPWQLDGGGSELSDNLLALLNPAGHLSLALAGCELSAAVPSADGANIEVEARSCKQGQDRRYAFDKTSGALASVVWPKDLRFDYERHVELGSHVFPARMKLSSEGRLLVKTSQRNARALRDVLPGEFAPPAQ